MGDEIKVIMLFIISVFIAFSFIFGGAVQQGNNTRKVCSELYSTTQDYFACTKEQNLSKTYSLIKRVR